MTLRRFALPLLTLAAFGLVAACNPVPIDNLERTFSLKVETTAGTDQQVKIDFLWVVDNSTSMCEEQVALASSFQEFTNTLTTFFAIDARLAVTSSDMQCDADPEQGINASKGKFNQVPADRFPAACYFKQNQQCTTDADCETGAGDAGAYKCTTENLEVCEVNPNNSINTTCRRLCDTDQDCADFFGDTGFQCLKPGGSSDSGCLKQPDSSGCDTDLPPFLSTEDGNIDSFPCIATLGVYSQKCFKYEQGLRAALTAIDPRPGALQEEQAKSFLRDDAYLVVIIVSDEDDCSTVDGQDFGEDFYNTCAFEATTDDGGILVPVRDYVNRLKSIKSDPSRVIVAAIAGDALAAQDVPDAALIPDACASLPGATANEPDAAAIEEYKNCVRQEFQASKTDPRTCHQKSYVCSGPGGISDWGSRYQQLANGFGTNGLFLNICEASGISAALDDIAAKIIQVVNKVCLPRRVLDTASLEVIKTLADGTTQITLVAGGDGDDGYTLEPPTADCVDGEGTLMPSLTFVKPPEPGESIEIRYEGDPLFDQVVEAQ